MKTQPSSFAEINTSVVRVTMSSKVTGCCHDKML